MKKRNLNLELEYGWEKTDFVYPNKYLGHNYPAIYTWVLFSNSGEKSYYLGETENLSRRIYHYMNPGPSQTTNIRLKKEMNKSKKVILYVLNMNTLQINGKALSKEDLKDKYIRKGIESLLIKELKISKNGRIIHNR